jgi:hypothetical protein
VRYFLRFDLLIFSQRAAAGARDREEFAASRVPPRP